MAGRVIFGIYIAKGSVKSKEQPGRNGWNHLFMRTRVKGGAGYKNKYYTKRYL